MARVVLSCSLAVLALLMGCRGDLAVCPGDGEEARAARAAEVRARLAALGEGIFTVDSFRVMTEDLVRWQDPVTLEGASTEEKRLVFRRVRFEAGLVFPDGGDLPRHPFRAALPAPTWETVNRNSELLRITHPRGRSPGHREAVAAWAIFDVTGPGTVRFRGFDDKDRDVLVPTEGCPDGRGGLL